MSLSDLQRLIGKDGEPNGGKIIAIADNTITISTPIGVRTVRRAQTDANNYKVGDSIRISGGSAVAILALKPNVYVV